MNCESLEEEIYNEGIDIIPMRFKGKIKGLYANNTIAIDTKIDTNREKTCVLAEELGHYHKTVGNILDQTKIENVKQEKIARKWGYEKLISLYDIITAFNLGIKNKHDLADYLDVTVLFLEEAIQHYREKYGIYYEFDNYIIYFEPNFGIMKSY